MQIDIVSTLLSSTLYKGSMSTTINFTNFPNCYSTLLSTFLDERRQKYKDISLGKEKAPLYEEALRDLTQDSLADCYSSRIKSRVRDAIEDQSTAAEAISLFERRARRLLQSACEFICLHRSIKLLYLEHNVLTTYVAFLDIEKLIEHRPPLDKLSFWSRPAIPQRELCSICDCSDDTDRI